MTDKKKNIKKEKLKIPQGKAHIRATFNNTIISITDMQGNSIAWASGGSVEFKNSRKATPYAAQLAARKAVETAIVRGIKELEIYVNGPGIGRDSAVRAIASSVAKVLLIKDITPVPHNGCRPQKKRRI